MTGFNSKSKLFNSSLPSAQIVRHSPKETSRSKVRVGEPALDK